MSKAISTQNSKSISQVSSSFSSNTVLDLHWKYNTLLSYYYDSNSDSLFLTAGDIALFLSQHTNRQFATSSIVNYCKSAIPKGVIEAPIKVTVNTSSGIRPVEVFNEASCCHFIKKYASNSGSLVTDCMQTSFRCYIEALFIGITAKLTNQDATTVGLDYAKSKNKPYLVVQNK